VLAFGRNWIKEYQLPIFWLALLFLFDWGVSLLTHCVGREPQQTNLKKATVWPKRYPIGLRPSFMTGSSATTA
jgi:hypothetical protein